MENRYKEREPVEGGLERMKRPRKTLQRMCVGCREMKEKKSLIRIVRDPEGKVEIDLTGKKSGRGAYLCNCPECLKKAIQTHALSRALDCTIPSDILENIQMQFNTK